MAQLAQSALGARGDAFPQHLREVGGAGKRRLVLLRRTERQKQPFEDGARLLFGASEEQHVLGQRGEQHGAEVKVKLRSLAQNLAAHDQCRRRE